MAAPSKPKYVDWTIAAGDITSDQTDFPFILDLSRLPSVGFWDTVTESDDLVVYTTAEVQLDCDCVYLDIVRETGVLVVKDNASSLVGNTLRVYFGESSPTSEQTPNAHGAAIQYASYDGGQTDRSPIQNGATVYTGTGHTINANGGKFDLPFVGFVGDRFDIGDYGTYTTNPPGVTLASVSTFQLRREQDISLPNVFSPSYWGAWWRHDANSGHRHWRHHENQSNRLIHFGTVDAQRTANFTSTVRAFNDFGQDITDWQTSFAGTNAMGTEDSVLKFDNRFHNVVGNDFSPGSAWAATTGIGGYNSAPAETANQAGPANQDFGVIRHYNDMRPDDWRTLEHRMWQDQATIWTIGAVTDNPDFGGGGIVDGSITFPGTGTFVLDGEAIRDGSITFPGAGTFTIDPANNIDGAITFLGDSAFQATPSADLLASIAFDCDGQFQATPVAILEASWSPIGIAAFSLTPDDTSIIDATATFAGGSAMQAAANVDYSASATFAGDGAFQATPVAILEATWSPVGIAAFSLTPDDVVVVDASATFAGSGSFIASPNADVHATWTANGAGFMSMRAEGAQFRTGWRVFVTIDTAYTDCEIRPLENR